MANTHNPNPEHLPRSLAFRDRYVWELKQTIEDYDCDAGLSEADETKLFSAMMTGADLSYPNEAHRLVWLFWQYLDCQPEPQKEIVIREVVRTIYQSSPELIEDELEEEMTRPTFQVYNSVLYIGIPCDCGGYDWYPTGGKAPLSPGGVPQPPSDAGGGGAYFGGGNVVQPSKADCYAERATKYLLQRATDWGHAVVDYSENGLALLGPQDEVYEIVQLTTDIITGNQLLPEIEQLTKDGITTALNDPLLEQKLIDAWTFDGAVAREDLRNWIARAIGVIDADFPIAVFLQAWLDYSIIAGYNDKLQEFAAACNEDVSLPGDEYTMSVNGTDYIAYRVVGIPTLTEGAGLFVTELTVNNIAGAAAITTVSDPASNTNNPSLNVTLGGSDKVRIVSGDVAATRVGIAADNTNLVTAIEDTLPGFSQPDQTKTDDINASGTVHVERDGGDSAFDATYSDTTLWVIERQA